MYLTTTVVLPLNDYYIYTLKSKFEIATSVTTVSPTHTKNLLYYYMIKQKNYIENVPTTMIVCHDYYYYYSSRFRDSILFHTSGHFKQLLKGKVKKKQIFYGGNYCLCQSRIMNTPNSPRIKAASKAYTPQCPKILPQGLLLLP